MKKLDKSANLHPLQADKLEQRDLDGYPLYPDNEDIYKKCKKERIIDPEEILNFKGYEKPEKRNEKDFDEDFPGEELDIPGAELTVEEGIIAGEDEENDYYSLGGDDHIDLEENLDK
jgi:hypothetical protein